MSAVGGGGRGAGGGGRVSKQVNGILRPVNLCGYIRAIGGEGGGGGGGGRGGE